MRSTLRLALRLLRRDWAYGELRVLLFALVVAVASMTAVGFFVDRIEQAMLHKASDLLGADLVILSTSPIGDAAAAGCGKPAVSQRRARSRFAACLVSGERFQLAEVKAVTDGYPLRGQLRVSASSIWRGRSHRYAIPAHQAPRGWTRVCLARWVSRSATTSSSARAPFASSACSATSPTAAATCLALPRACC